MRVGGVTVSERQSRLGNPTDLPDCEVDGCERPALWRLTCTASIDAEAVRCDVHSDEPEPFVGAYGAALTFDRRHIGRDD
jgi:hypothetical protein